MTSKNDNVNYKPMFLLSAMFMGIIGSGFMSKEEALATYAPSIMEQKEAVKLFTEAPVEITAGDSESVIRIAKAILGEEIPPMVTPQLKSKEGLTSVYQLGEYEMTLENFNLKKSSEQEIFVSFRKVTSLGATKEDALVLTTVSEENATSLANEVVSTYRLKVAVSDTTAPVIRLVQDEDTITEGDDFDPQDYIKSVIDDVDGKLSYETESDVDTETPGVYTVTYRAKDNAGNEASANVTITVEEKPAAVIESSYESGSYNGGGQGSVSINGSVVANAALSQLGANQDCTMLVTNSLAAAGINFHGWPAEYMSLGTIVSGAEAQPGDIIYYADSGVGTSHVAIYLGGNQAVHGGWGGATTTVAGAYMGSGPVFIHIAQ